MTSPSAFDSPPAAARAPCSPWRVVCLGLLACAASLSLYALPIARPLLVLDDFQIVFRSWTWPKAWTNLWVPANEHAMPLGRLTTCALAALAQGRPSVFLTLIGWHGPLALVAGMVLLGVFVGRERRQPFYGLIAMTLFGVSTTYQNAIYWYSASFSVLALDTILLALLAAQQAVRTGGRWPLALCWVGCALAPGWFAIGILAGPLCSFYLLLATSERNATGASAWERFRRLGRGDLLRVIIPILGSLAFLAVSLPVTGNPIMHLPHYGDKTAVQAFHPATGVIWACRSVVDNLAWSLVGVSHVMCPEPWVWIPFAAILALVIWWVWRAPRKTPVLLGLGVIGLSYGLVYSARAEWDYEKSVVNWDRYHLLPQMGLALILAGGLPSPRPRAGVTAPTGLSSRQVWAILILIAGLFVTQLPRGVLAHVIFSHEAEMSDNPFACPLPRGWYAHWIDAELHEDQRKALRRIEKVDALCVKYHIAAADAQRALAEIRIEPCDCVDEPRNESNWQFLHGSDDPCEYSDDEIRRLLQPPDPE